MRLVALWLVLFGVYAATLGLPASRGGSEYGSDEPHYLLIAESLVSDGDLDVADEYAARAYAEWMPGRLETNARPTGAALHEPQGAGFPLLIAPAYALGGARLVELLLAAVAAFAFVLAAMLARFMVPEPYASAGAAVAGLSPPAVAHATAVYPELVAGALLAAAALCALTIRRGPGSHGPRSPAAAASHGARSFAAAVAGAPHGARSVALGGAARARGAAPALGGAAMLALLPWLGIKYAVPAAPVAVALVVWCSRAGRRLLGIVSAELIVGSLVFYATINERLYGGPTPYSAGLPGRTPFDSEPAGEYAERAGRLAGLWLDRDFGLLRWAPVFALAFFAGWLLLRSRRERLARLVPEHATAEAAAGLALAICGGQILVAAFGAPTMHGDWFPARQLAPALPAAAALCAWGLRHAPRAGAALAAITVAATAWLLIARDPLAPPTTAAPWGPLEPLFPDYRTATVWGVVAAALIAAALVAVAVREWRRGLR